MIEWILQHADGRQHAIGEPSSFRLSYGLGSPCDSFSLRATWKAGQESLLNTVSRVLVKRDGELIFFGVLDEWECCFDASGYTLELHGRGMQALLLDNEAQSADYGVATLSDILLAYVTPYGIQTVGQASLPPVSGFSVKSGSSCWQVLYQFARYYGGVAPRFDRQGRLLLSPFEDTAIRSLSCELPLTKLLLRHKRYGVLSQVQVQNSVTKAIQTVKNEAFCKEGGSCSRVLCVPRNTGYQSMRYTAQYQLVQSERERVRLEVSIAEGFVAWPGELVEVKLYGFGGNGRYRVLETSVSLGAEGYETELLLGDAEKAL